MSPQPGPCRMPTRGRHETADARTPLKPRKSSSPQILCLNAYHVPVRPLPSADINTRSCLCIYCTQESHSTPPGRVGPKPSPFCPSGLVPSCMGSCWLSATVGHSDEQQTSSPGAQSQTGGRLVVLASACPGNRPHILTQMCMRLCVFITDSISLFTFCCFSLNSLLIIFTSTHRVPSLFPNTHTICATPVGRDL